MGEADLSASFLEKLAIQRREQPGLHFGDVAELVTFAGPNQERFLGQIASVILVPRQTECELVKAGIVTVHETFQVRSSRHAVVVISKSHSCSNCSRGEVALR